RPDRPAAADPPAGAAGLAWIAALREASRPQSAHDHAGAGDAARLPLVVLPRRTAAAQRAAGGLACPPQRGPAAPGAPPGRLSAPRPRAGRGPSRVAQGLDRSEPRGAAGGIVAEGHAQ